MDTSFFPNYPGWEIVRKIGSGSYGAVYEIERDVLGHKEKAALKVISVPENESCVEELYSSGLDRSSVTEHFQTVLSEIVREYQFMSDIKGHANIVRCDDIRYIQKDDGIGWNIYIRMELLTPLIKSVGETVFEEQVIRLGKDICQALIACRKRSILHCDIKPQNIYVSGEGNYKLGDFGVAKTAERTSGGTKIGTYNYMAPEVFNDQPYGHSADIYSLGLVMYWMLNNRRLPFYPPWPAVALTSEMDDARRRRFSGESIPEPVCGSKILKAIVLKACDADINRRYTTAEELLHDLILLENEPNLTELPVKAITEELPKEKMTASLLQPRLKSFGREKLLTVCAIVAVAFILLFMLLLQCEKKDTENTAGLVQKQTAGHRCRSTKSLSYALVEGRLAFSSC